MRRIAMLIFFLFTLSAFFFLVAWEKSITALISNGAEIFNNDEKEFPEPIDIAWKGKIISVMAGGSCAGIEGQFGDYSKAMVCLADSASDELNKYSGELNISGKWLGITCAYKNTIFGECVPIVEVDVVH
jgi:hypothetical protein